LDSQQGHSRLKPGEEDFPYDLESILGNPFHMDARRPVDRLLRYERVLEAKTAWTPLDFEGKRVLEIGCGPLLGWGPIAVYLGSTEYVCIEPRYRSEVLESDVVWTRFFLPLYQQLDALFDRGISFDDFADRVRSRIQVDPVAIKDCTRAGGMADIVVSNGVLHHIAELDSALDRIKHLSHASTRQFHVIHFNDHMSPPDTPFREIYRQDPAEYFARDSLLNLKRPSEISALFDRMSIPVTVIPYIVDQAIEPYDLAPYWTQFDKSDLAIQIAFFVN